MGLSVTFVSGPRRSGKSALIRAMVDRFRKVQPHYIRLVKSGSDKRPPDTSGTCSTSQPECKVASARWVEYETERIFEILPDVLTAIYRHDRYGAVVIEADADPNLRCAYPYDHRVFVMPVPTNIREVFREPSCAADELQRTLDDTVAFAAEIFGLYADDEQDKAEPSEPRPDPTTHQMRSFLYSPLGDELATRIQLQPQYHGLVESDVIVVNSNAGDPGPEAGECLRRVERLLNRLRGVSKRRGELFLCDPGNTNGRSSKRLLKALRPMLRAGN